MLDREMKTSGRQWLQSTAEDFRQRNAQLRKDFFAGQLSSDFSRFFEKSLKLNETDTPRSGFREATTCQPQSSTIKQASGSDSQKPSNVTKKIDPASTKSDEITIKNWPNDFQLIADGIFWKENGKLNAHGRFCELESYSDFSGTE